MLYYDFHIHSCLSPCADNDMTPGNIVSLSLLLGLDAIAVTDHNSIGNVRAVMQAAKGKPIAVLPGIELETSEEVHILCLFSDYEDIREFDRELSECYRLIQNKPEIFGEQIIMDEHDNIIGYEDRLLVTATTIGINSAASLVHKYHGVCIAAHVDKPSFGVISNLGFISDDMGLDAIEISKNTRPDEFFKTNPYLSNYLCLRNSDAHYLEDISLRTNFLSMEQPDPRIIVQYMKKKA